VARPDRPVTIAGETDQREADPGDKPKRQKTTTGNGNFDSNLVGRGTGGTE
jgi:hypothetical protein